MAKFTVGDNIKYGLCEAIVTSVNNTQYELIWTKHSSLIGQRSIRNISTIDHLYHLLGTPTASPFKFQVGDTVVSIAHPMRRYKITHLNTVGKTYECTIISHEDQSKIGQWYENSMSNFDDPAVMQLYSSGVKSSQLPYVTLDNLSPTEREYVAQSQPKQHKCSCPLRDLLMNGCKCGGI
jgi:hypothetical protein